LTMSIKVRDSKLTFIRGGELARIQEVNTTELVCLSKMQRGNSPAFIFKEYLPDKAPGTDTNRPHL